MSSFKNSWEKVILCPIMMENWVYDEQLFCLYVIDPVNIVTDSFSTLSLESFKLNCQPSWTYVQNYWTSNNSFVLIFYLAAFNFSAFLFFCERPFFFFFYKKILIHFIALGNSHSKTSNSNTPLSDYKLLYFHHFHHLMYYYIHCLTSWNPLFYLFAIW